MKTKVAARKPKLRLRTGDGILGAAGMVDTKCVKGPLAAFAEVHRSYCEAQRKADEVESQLAAVQSQVESLDADQDDAVEAVAVSLISNGYKRNNPLASFNGASPWSIKALPVADKAQAIHALADTLRRSKLVPAPTLEAVQRAEQVAHNVEAALQSLETLGDNLQKAREQRDTVAQTWDANLKILRHVARAKSVLEAPGLHTALFGRRSRASKKPVSASDKAAQPTPAPAPPATAAPEPPATAASAA